MTKRKNSYMAPCQGNPGPCGDVPTDVPNRPLHKFSYWKGARGQETSCSLEFPHICDFGVSSYVEFINEENLLIEYIPIHLSSLGPGMIFWLLWFVTQAAGHFSLANKIVLWLGVRYPCSSRPHRSAENESTCLKIEISKTGDGCGYLNGDIHF